MNYEYQTGKLSLKRDEVGNYCFAKPQDNISALQSRLGESPSAKLKTLLSSRKLL